MKRPLFVGVSLFLATSALVGQEPNPKSKAKVESKNASCHGTAVEFVATPIEAARLAAEQKKLVAVLHVSGHFEDPGFT